MLVCYENSKRKKKGARQSNFVVPFNLIRKDEARVFVPSVLRLFCSGARGISGLVTTKVVLTFPNGEKAVQNENCKKKKERRKVATVKKATRLQNKEGGRKKTGKEQEPRRSTKEIWGMGSHLYPFSGSLLRVGPFCLVNSFCLAPFAY